MMDGLRYREVIETLEAEVERARRAYNETFRAGFLGQASVDECAKALCDAIDAGIALEFFREMYHE